jgi:hypothetical protein
MDQILFYTTVGFSEQYLDVFSIFCESLCFTTASYKNLLVIADEKFVERIKEIASKYAMLRLYIMSVTNSTSPEEASKQKTRIFDFELIRHFRICLYIDVDCVFLDNLFKMFKFPIKDGKLYVFAESSKINDNKKKWFSLTDKSGQSYYTPSELDFLEKEQKFPFNAGLFMFKISSLNECQFKGFNKFMNGFDGEGFYEQSFMNTYFNLNGMSDYSYFLETVAMQSTHIVDKSITETNSCFDESSRQPITSKHILLHFNATLPGKGLTKFIAMRRYLNLLKKTRKLELKIYDNRESMIDDILPEGAVLAEIGVFKGDFADKLLSCNPSQFHLIDCWAKGPVMSGNADGNNVERIADGEKLFDLVSNRFKFNETVIIHRDMSFNVLGKFDDNSLDAIYVDGDHSYEGVKRDLTLAVKKVKKYGLIMGHDYEMNMTKAKTAYNFGVKRAVDEFCEKFNLKVYAKAMDGCVSFAIVNTVQPLELNSRQFICISVNEERGARIRKQCAELFPEIRLNFLNSKNDDSYFPTGVTIENRKILDCALNHFKAIRLAAEDSSPEFSIIIEDDISFHETDFLPTLDELLANWDEYMKSETLASIGWIPLKNYAEYKDFNLNMKYSHYKVTWKFFGVGFQAYVVRKRDLAKYINILNKPTYNDFLATVKSMNLECTDNTMTLMPCDYILPRLMGQRIIFPPVAMEMDLPSQLSHTNKKYWDNYFKGNEKLKKGYYGFSD